MHATDIHSAAPASIGVAPSALQTPDWKPSAWKVLLAAVIAGIDGDLLLRGGTWRIGFALWIGGLIVSVFVIGGRATTQRQLLLAGMALAVLGLVWRDSEMLYAIDMLSLLAVGALTIWHGTGRSLASLSIVESARAGIIAGLNTAFGAAGVLGEVTAKPDTADTRKATLRSLAIGAALAAFPLLVVTGLLAASDKVFETLMDRVGETLFNDGLSHVFSAGILAWVGAGWLRAALGAPIGTSVPEPRSPGLRFMSVAVGLYSLLALLATYLATQVRVLFGGAEFLRVTQGLTVAEYAREGFFQLLVASGVVLITLVVAEWLLATDDRDGLRHYRRVASLLLMLVGTLLVSSGVRIWLYMSEFGLTVDRSFAAAGILWVGATLVAFALTTLRGQPTRFMPAAIGVAVAWVTMVNVINPEALVVRVNVARAAAGETFDAAYHAKLSADALPTLVDAAPRLSVVQCTVLEMELRQRWQERLKNPNTGGTDWRGRNLPLRNARAWWDAGAHACSQGRTAVSRTASAWAPMAR
jgi:Domain of unknown function (DUF4173)